MQIRGHGTLREREHNNDGWGGRVLVDEGSDGKQGIYFAWPIIATLKHRLYILCTKEGSNSQAILASVW